jgi:DNA-binding MurR/RpiR family transcriptional regulator
MRVAALAEVTRTGADAVRDAGALVDPAAFETAVSAIGDAARVVFVGVRTSAPLCRAPIYRHSDLTF